MLTYAINLKLNIHIFLCKLIIWLGLTPTSCHHCSTENDLSLCDKGTANQCCQGLSFPTQLGYFEKAIVGKIWHMGCLFLGYFCNVPRPQKVYIDK